MQKNHKFHSWATILRKAKCCIMIGSIREAVLWLEVLEKQKN